MFFEVTLYFSVAYFKKSSGLSEGCPAQLLRGLALLEAKPSEGRSVVPALFPVRHGLLPVCNDIGTEAVS